MAVSDTDKVRRLRRLRRGIFTGLALVALLEALTSPFEVAGSPLVTGAEFLSSAVAVIATWLIAYYLRSTGGQSRYSYLLVGMALATLAAEFAIRLGIGASPFVEPSAGFRYDYAIRGIELVEAGYLFVGLIFIVNQMQRALYSSETARSEIRGELLRAVDADAALRALVESTAAESGESLLKVLTRRLAETLGVKFAFIASVDPSDPCRMIRSRAYWEDGKFGDPFVVPAEGTPCANVLDGRPTFYGARLRESFPGDDFLKRIGAESYLGAPIYSASHAVVGHVAVMHDAPMEDDPRREWILRVFGERAGVEMDRLGQEARLRDQAGLIESAADSIITVDFNGNVLSWNRGAETLYGYSEEEMIGESLSVLSPDNSDRSAFVRGFRDNAVRGVTISNAIQPRRCKDGHIVQVSLSTFPVYDENGAIRAYSGIARDVTKEVMQRHALEESEARFRAFFSSVPDLISVIGRDGTIQYQNRVMVGSMENVLGRKAADFLPPEARESGIAMIERAFETGEPATVPEVATPSGLTFRVRLEPVVAAGAVTQLLVIATDISQPVQQERALRESESKLRGVFENVPDMIRLLKPDGTITYANHSFSGLSPEQLNGQNIFDFVPPENREYSREVFARVVASGEVSDIEATGLYTGRLFRSRLAPIRTRGDAGPVDEVLMVATDISTQRRHEGELRDARDRYQFLAERMNDIIWEVDSEFKLSYITPSMERITGYSVEECVGQLATFNAVPEDLPRLATLFQGAIDGVLEDALFEYRMTTKAGRQVHCELSAVARRDSDGKLIGFQGVTRDITNRMRAEQALGESETRLRGLFQSVPDFILVTNLEGRVLFANQTPSSHPEGVIGISVFDLVAEPYRATARSHFERAAASGRAQTAELGEPESGRLYSTQMVPLREPGNAENTSEILIISADVTRERLRETALKDAKEQYQFLTERMNDLIWQIDATGLYTYASPSFERVLGYRPEEVIGQSAFFNVAPEEETRILQSIAALVEARARDLAFEYKVLHKTQPDPVLLDVRAVLLYDSSENFAGIQGVTRDITERKQAEHSLQRSEERFRFLADRMNDVIWRLDREFRYTYVAPSVERITGYTAEECIGQVWSFNTPTDNAEEITAAVERALKDRTDEAFFEMHSLTKDGSEVIYEVSVVALRDEHGHFAGLQGVARDITQRRTAELALREREALYRLIVETSHEGICLASEDNRIVFVNPRMAQMLGYWPDQMIARSLADFVAPEDKEHGNAILKRIRLESGLGVEFKFRAKDGSVVWADIAASRVWGDGGEPRGILAMVSDISERKRAESAKRDLEAQVQHAQKLESLGVLAGGIAHDFNNLLAGIMGYASLLSQDFTDEDPRKAYVEKIELASNRAAELTRQMLAYSGKGRFVLEQIDMTRLTTEMLDLIQASISKKAQTEFELGDELPMVHGDPSQLGQVIMNLVINASDSLQDRPGRIVVRTSLIEASEELLRRSIAHSEDARPGWYVKFETADTGCGMDEDTVKRIFDPFFTTKFTGRGLGLAAALGIVRGHHGAFIVDSTPGKGTTMQVLLPVSPDAGEERGRRRQVVPKQRPDLAGTALVADDDPVVLGLASEILERHGMVVARAEDGEAALALFRANPMGFRVVLLDLTMPKLNGQEAFKAIRELRGDIPVIISSGYAERETLEQIGEHASMGFLQKPYRNAELIEKVKNALEGASVHVAK